MVHIRKIKYYSTIQRDKLLINVATWMNIKMIILSERNQTQKTAHSRIPFIGNIQKREKTESRLMAILAVSWYEQTLG